MARIRTTKPEFWTSEQVVECSPLARLLFIGSWSFCDDAGIHPASLKRLKMEVFPGDDFSISDIERLVAELIDNGLLLAYKHDSKHYWAVTGWHQHQKIDRPTYKYPQPNGENSTIIRRSSVDLSQRQQPNLDEASPPEGNGRESNGKERLSLPDRMKKGGNAIDDVNKVFDFWKLTLKHPKSVLDEKRKKVIRSALRNYSVDDLFLAITGCSRTPHNMGKNENKQIYDGLHIIFKDADNIERFMSNSGSIIAPNNPIRKVLSNG